MKTFLLSLFLFGFYGVLAAQVEARVHQVFEVKDATALAVDIDDSKYEVNIKETYSTVIIVEVIVALDLATPGKMEEIIQTGRYKVDMKMEEGVATFFLNKDLQPLFINGQEAEEYVIFNVSLPEYLDYHYK